MEQWEYKLGPTFVTEVSLNAFGAEGWELVQVTTYNTIFKRRRNIPTKGTVTGRPIADRPQA